MCLPIPSVITLIKSPVDVMLNAMAMTISQSEIACCQRVVVSTR